MSVVEDRVAQADPLIELGVDGAVLEHGDFKKTLVPGQVYDDIPNAAYHRGPGLSSSNLKALARSPLHYRTAKDHPKAPTAEMALGTALHTLILEPDTFEATYAALPADAPKRPTERQLNAKKPGPATLAAITYWAQWDADHAGQTLVDTRPGDDPFWKPSDWDRIHYMRDAIMAHPVAALFLQSFVPELSMYWLEPTRVPLDEGDVEHPQLAKARFDIIDQAHNLGVDIKTARDASYSGFTRAVVEYGYHISRQWYMRGQRTCGLDLQEFVFIVVEKEPPWGVGCYNPRPAHEGAGRQPDPGVPGDLFAVP